MSHPKSTYANPNRRHQPCAGLYPIQKSKQPPKHPLLAKHDLLILPLIQVSVQQALQRGSALRNGRHDAVDLLQVAAHALHVTADLLRDEDQLVVFVEVLFFWNVSKHTNASQ